MRAIRKAFPLSPDGQEENFVEASFYYDLGGVDWASGRRKPRGYYVSLLPMRVTERDGVVLREFEPFGGGGWTLLAEAPRQSKSRERAALAECQRRLPELMSIVLENTGFKLEAGTELAIA